MSGLFDQFKEWYEKRHDYARAWKARTGGQVVATMCTYTPEEILIAANMLPVRVCASDELRDGLAAVAADGLVAPGDAGVDHRTARDRLAAVEAGRACGGHGFGWAAASRIRRASSPQTMVTPSLKQSLRTSVSGRVTARYSVRLPPITAAAGGTISSQGHS